MRRYMFPIILLLTDIVTLCISLWLAVVLRFFATNAIYQAYVSSTMLNLPIYIFCHLVFFCGFKLYNRIWKYAGIKEMLSIVGANILGMLFFMGARVVFSSFTGSPLLVSKLLLVLVCFFNISFIFTGV